MSDQILPNEELHVLIKSYWGGGCSFQECRKETDRPLQTSKEVEELLPGSGAKNAQHTGLSGLTNPAALFSPKAGLAGLRVKISAEAPWRDKGPAIPGSEGILNSPSPQSPSSLFYRVKAAKSSGAAPSRHENWLVGGGASPSDPASKLVRQGERRRKQWCPPPGVGRGIERCQGGKEGEAGGAGSRLRSGGGGSCPWCSAGQSRTGTISLRADSWLCDARGGRKPEVTSWGLLLRS